MTLDSSTTPVHSVKTFESQIFVGLKPGYDSDYSVQKQTDIAMDVIRGEIEENKFGVTVTKTTFMYPGGSEDGLIIGLINYPRFPDYPFVIANYAYNLAFKLKKALKQHRVTVMSIGDKFENRTIMLGEK